MNIYVVPEIDIERFKETGVFAVQLLNNEAMAHDGIYLESDRAKEFAEFFKDNIFPAEKFEELVEWGIKADAESASLVRAIIHSRVWEYEQKRAMTMDQVLVQFCIREWIPAAREEHRDNDAWNIRPELLPGMRNKIGGRVNGTQRRKLLHLRMA